MAAEKRSEAATRAREAQQQAAAKRLAQQQEEKEETVRRTRLEVRGEGIRQRWAETRENAEQQGETVCNCNADSRNCSHHAHIIWWSRKNERG